MKINLRGKKGSSLNPNSIRHPRHTPAIGNLEEVNTLSERFVFVGHTPRYRHTEIRDNNMESVVVVCQVQKLTGRLFDKQDNDLIVMEFDNGIKADTEPYRWPGLQRGPENCVSNR